MSGKNANVMFELGLRLAFDKPTVIVKDDHTSYSFDTAPIEHLEYPRDLRFSKIVDFKHTLAEKIVSTHKRATSDQEYTTFLKNFGQFTVAKLEKREVSGQKFIMEELRSIKQAIRRLERIPPPPPKRVRGEIEVCLGRSNDHNIDEAARIASAHPGVREVVTRDLGPRHEHLTVFLNPDAEIEERSFLKSVRDGTAANPGSNGGIKPLDKRGALPGSPNKSDNFLGD